MMSSSLSPTLEKIPQHIGIIMDGNGRWALKRGLPRLKGHIEGGNRAIDVIMTANSLGIKVLTLFGFSTENWERPQEEVSFLMDLMLNFIQRKTQKLHAQGIKIQALGQIYRAPETHQKAIAHAEELTKNNAGMILNFCLSYGARGELTRAVQNISKLVQKGELAPEEISEETISQHLYTTKLPDPDLIIRTSGEYRISNFLLWQSAYSELYITDVLWPDFNAEEFKKACLEYSQRERRFGKCSEKKEAIDSSPGTPF